ncbi:hypothetical protein G9A89_009150 [Geosiphon pyriformis]|nr:hypothetical protein G9A89_009150 [Geosiphon pyriformis]
MGILNVRMDICRPICHRPLSRVGSDHLGATANVVSACNDAPSAILVCLLMGILNVRMDICRPICHRPLSRVEKKSNEVKAFWLRYPKNKSISLNGKTEESSISLVETKVLNQERQDDGDIGFDKRSCVNKIRTSIGTETPNSSSANSSYVLPSPSSFDSLEVLIDKSNKYYLNYFTGPGITDWVLKKASIRWIVCDVDISEICLEYRATTIQKCECESTMVTLSANEELALSHVFVFQEDNYEFQEYFDDEVWESLFIEFRNLYPYEPISNEVCELFVKVVKTASEKPNQRERRAILTHYLEDFENTDNEDEMMVELIRNLIENESSSFTKNYHNEDTHIHYNVAPIIRPFFKSKKTVVDWANKMSVSSALAKKSFDPSLLGAKPDFTIKTINTRKYIELLIGEVKPPNTRDVLIDKDLISLGKTMKNALDKSIEDGVNDMIICGFQIIGFLGRAYVMDLLFDGVYRMLMIGEFRLPEGYTSWGTILGCYQILNTIKVIVDKGAVHYQSAIRKNVNQTKSEKIKMIKPMFHSPMKVPIGKNPDDRKDGKVQFNLGMILHGECKFSVLLASKSGWKAYLEAEMFLVSIERYIKNNNKYQAIRLLGMKRMTIFEPRE